ncbi:MAG: BON domain-containing protein [Lysobacteraceae bacterium]|nr:MAG: BON domain-containing protein [Xanthomonadaceae bacterium]
MGMFDFIKNAGEKIFKPGEAKKEAAIKQHLGTFGGDYSGIDVEVDGETATLTGTVPNNTAREKAVLIAGNIDGIEKVDDRLAVSGSASSAPAPDFSNVSGGVTSTEASIGAGSAAAATASAGGGEAESKFYTVQKGDTLSKIAREFYGEASKYPQIFEANKPMLKDPDKIYPGQMLRIPPEV